MENAFGIIGGMGPMATNLLYKMITEKTPAASDNDHINMIILNHATMPDRTGAIQGTEEDRQKIFRLLREDASLLENAGVKGICVPCNTAHFFMHRLEQELSVPLISMIREASLEMGRRYPGGKVAILGTEGTIGAEIYQPFFREYGLEPYVVPAEIQKHVTHLIYDNIKAGKRAEQESLDIIHHHLEDSGCISALLACTELSVIKADGRFRDMYVDAMDILASRIIEFMGKTSRLGRGA